MTNDRSLILADVLLEDKEYAEKLLRMSPEAAAEELSKKGYDFSANELIEFGNELSETSKIYSETGELDEEVLGKVSAGCSKCFMAGEWVAVIAITVAVACW